MAPARRASSRWLATRDERDVLLELARRRPRRVAERPLASGVAQSSMPSGSRPSSYTPRKRSSSVCTSALSSGRATSAITHLATFEPRSADFVWSDLKKPVPAGFGNSMIRSSGSSW